ncbi:MAG: carboxylate--amine ligase [Acidimicrobiales bacterium]
MRSLGRRGVPVDVLGDGVSSPHLRHSRYCRRYAGFLAGPELAGRWLDWLAGCSPGTVVMPCGDEGLELLARRRDRMVSLGLLPIEADDAVLLSLLDKAETYRRAGEIGIAVPATTEINDLATLRTAVRDSVFPCVVKPAVSHLAGRLLNGTSPMPGAAKAVLACAPGELETAVHPFIAAGVPMLASEFVTGPDDRFCSYYTYLDEAGRPLVELTKRKLRQLPVHFGGGTFHLVDWQPDVAEAGRRLFQGLGLRGLGNAEFKRRAGDGQLVLIECNARLTAANDLVRRSGPDLAWLSYARAAGMPTPEMARRPDGLAQWLPLRDWRALSAYRAAGELSLPQWLSSLAPVLNIRPPVLAADDLAPSIADGLRRARSRLSGLSGRGARH